MKPVIQDESTHPSVFDEWADVYDAQPNPLLSLEARTLDPFLPAGAEHILDIGCGTGRWLGRLEQMEPISLVGIDSSPRMLRYARTKVRTTTELRAGDGTCLPSESGSQDLLLASFVISYLPDLDAFAAECERVMRPDAVLLLSDMHPGTAARFNWRRSFGSNGKHRDIDVPVAPLESTLETFERHKLELKILLEPSFGLAEEAAFREAGRLDDYRALAESPAIYIAKLRKPGRRRFIHRFPVTDTLHLAQAQVAQSAQSWMAEELVIEGAYIQTSAASPAKSGATLDLSGYSILPGLVNAHDHLEFGLFPRLGRDADAPPYQNAAQWALEIQSNHRGCIDTHRSIPLRTRLWWGALRNALCGVTTVCHHNPTYPEFDEPDFPVHVVSRFGWAHSLAFEDHLEERYLRTSKEMPFILHAAEGVDEISRGEIFELDRRKLLGDRTVLVHGIGLTASGIDLLNDRGSALICCPTSNYFLFHQAPSLPALLTVRRLALGSDSSITADGDLLDEIRCLSGTVGMREDLVYKLVTTGAAEVLRLHDHAGKISWGGPADLIAVRSLVSTPATALCTLSFEKIELVIRRGKIQVASDSLYNQLPPAYRAGLHRLTVGGTARWLRAPLQALVASAEEVLGPGNLMLSGRQAAYAATI